MNALILHPTEATPVPVTIIETKRPRKPRAKKAAQGWSDLTVAELRQACASRGVKYTTKHTKPELIAMAKTGVYVVPAAYARAKAKRQAS